MDTIQTNPNFVSIFTTVFMKLEDMMKDPTIEPTYSFCLSRPDKSMVTLEIAISREKHPVDPNSLPRELQYEETKAVSLMRVILGENWQHPKEPAATYLDEENVALLSKTLQAIAGPGLSCYSEPGSLVIGYDNCRVLFLRHDLQ